MFKTGAKLDLGVPYFIALFFKKWVKMGHLGQEDTDISRTYKTSVYYYYFLN